VPYSPELVQQLRSAAIATKDQADLKIKESNANSLRGFRKLRLDQHDTTNELAERRVAVAEAREERVAKTGGGKAVASPQTGEIQQAARLIKGDFKDLDSTELMNAAFSIAAEAKALRAQNRGLDAETALGKAYATARSRGDFKEVGEKGTFRDTRKPTFVGGGRTPDTAIAVPADSKKLVTGRYYSNKAGAVAKWTGAGFSIAGGLPEDNTNADDDDEEED
jgi:hypothetical protein